VVDSAFALTAGIFCGAGGDCNVDTSVEAVWPADPVKEGSRAIWELSQVEVLRGTGR
jgi:hypothetical protein